MESTTTGQEYCEDRADDEDEDKIATSNDIKPQEEMIDILMKIFPEKDKVYFKFISH